MQEAYCPPRSKYSLCCPILGGTPFLAGGGEGYHPTLGYPPSDPHLGLGYPSRKGPGTSHWGTTPERTWKYCGVGYPPPPNRTWDHGSIMRWMWCTSSPCVNRQTPVKTVPSRRTTYAGSKNKRYLENNAHKCRLRTHNKNTANIWAHGKTKVMCERAFR